MTTTDLMPVATFVREALEVEGVRFDELLRRAGIAALPFHGERLRVTTKQFFALWNTVDAWGVAPDFGLRLVTQPLPQQFDVALAAALHSGNFGEALAKLARYKRLTCPERIDVALEGSEAQIRVVWLCEESAVPALIIDGAFAMLHRLAAIGTGQSIAPLRLELRRTPEHENMLTRHFDCEIRFNATSDALVFRKSDLALPFRSHNLALLDLLVPGLEAALKERAASTSLKEHVRAALLKQMRGRRPSIDQVAKELCVSNRTLQRRLGDEGTTYQRLLDDVRRDVACRLLAETELDAGEIAFVLGFEELNSFTRAFQSWEGTTPNRWRSARVLAATQSAQARVAALS